MSNKFDYWFWENYFNSKQIIEINKFIEKNFDKIEEDKFVAKDLKGNLKKNTTVKCISWKKVKNLFQQVHVDVIESARKNFGYDVYDVSANDDVLLNTYSFKNKSAYGWHIDSGESDLFDIKLTVLINLSLKEYEGGDFKIFNQNEMIIEKLKKPGNMIMFKSKLNHCVTPVIKGERKTLTIFINGPKFR